MSAARIRSVEEISEGVERAWRRADRALDSLECFIAESRARGGYDSWHHGDLFEGLHDAEQAFSDFDNRVPYDGMGKIVHWRAGDAQSAIKDFDEIEHPRVSKELQPETMLAGWIARLRGQIAGPCRVLLESLREGGGAEEDVDRVRARVRWMIRRDLPEVCRIETESHEHPWCEEDFFRCLRQRNCIGKVATVGESVVGFTIYELQKRQRRFLNFAVHPEHRRGGIGRLMIEKELSGLMRIFRDRLTVEVRETDLDAQLFFREMGLKATGVSREFYADSGEDAFAMQYVSTSHPRTEDFKRWKALAAT